MSVKKLNDVTEEGRFVDMPQISGVLDTKTGKKYTYGQISKEISSEENLKKFLERQ